MIDKYEEIDLGLGLLLDFSFRKFDWRVIPKVIFNQMLLLITENDIGLEFFFSIFFGGDCIFAPIFPFF